MRIQFLGAAGTVTGSCFLLDTSQSRILIDCGMFQGSKEVRERNYSSFYVPPRSIQYVLLTHAHIDHSGLIPKLVKHGFKGKIYATPATIELCEVLLPDSGYIQEMEVERKNRKNRRAGRPMIEPVYNVDEAYKSLPFFQPAGYNQIIRISPDVRVRFVDAGHILGSAMIEVWVQEGSSEIKLVFSGDIGNHNRPIVNDPSTIAEADYVIMESTYGNRLYQQHCDKEIELLHEIIWDTYKKGGNLIIPAFAVERTQDLLYHLILLMEEQRMPPMQVYIDSPLATAATNVFQRHRDCYDQEARELVQRGGCPVIHPSLKFTLSAEESKSLNQISGAIIISASGMCEAGRIRHHLKYNLWRPESTVLFIGYQAEGTLGRLILDGQKSVRIFGDEITVKADIRNIECYSSHADQAGLLSWIKKFSSPPREVFLVHGEPDASESLADLIRVETGQKVTIPAWQQIVELDPLATEPDAAVKQAYRSLSGKIGNLLSAGVNPLHREEILNRLAELEAFIEERTVKTSGV
jgi:metallo-beta-lactamase family protein